MSNIIQFPLDRRKKQLEAEEDLYTYCIDEAEGLTQLMVEDMASLIESDYVVDPSIFDDFDFRDPKNPEAKDMYVIANLINSMFLRYLGIKHNLHPELDRTHKHILEMQKRNDTT